jgi:hypothetical protein
MAVIICRLWMPWKKSCIPTCYVVYLVGSVVFHAFVGRMPSRQGPPPSPPSTPEDRPLKVKIVPHSKFIACSGESGVPELGLPIQINSRTIKQPTLIFFPHTSNRLGIHTIRLALLFVLHVASHPIFPVTPRTHLPFETANFPFRTWPSPTKSFPAGLDATGRSITEDHLVTH